MLVLGFSEIYKQLFVYKSVIKKIEKKELYFGFNYSISLVFFQRKENAEIVSVKTMVY